MLVSAVPPVMVKTGEKSRRHADRGVRRLSGRSCREPLPILHGRRLGAFYGYNRPGAKVSQGVILNWWRQGMMGSAKAHYEGIKAFSETDQTEDLKAITVPVLVLHGEDDQVVPIDDSGRFCQGGAEGYAQDVSWLSARHAHRPRGRPQYGFARFCLRLTAGHPACSQGKVF